MEHDWEDEAEEVISALFVEGYDPELHRRVLPVAESLAVALKSAFEKGMKTSETEGAVTVNMTIEQATSVFSLVDLAHEIAEMPQNAEYLDAQWDRIVAKAKRLIHKSPEEEKP
jgi:cobyrinic acid a,c-diamide synthase